jgi:hypothetical protein
MEKNMTLTHRMKNLVLSLSMVSASVSASLAMIPAAQASAPSATSLIGNCWTESGQDLADGEFIVNLETKSISKSKLLEVKNRLNGPNLEPTSYPLIFGDNMFISVRAVDRSLPAMTRVELKATVQSELEAIVATSRGISASCNFISYPAPAVGVRN